MAHPARTKSAPHRCVAGDDRSRGREVSGRGGDGSRRCRRFLEVRRHAHGRVPVRWCLFGVRGPQLRQRSERIRARAPRLLRPGAPLMLVVFGTCCPGEIIVELARGRPGNAFRRFNRGDVPARLGARQFTVRYHRGRDLQRMLAPYFRLERREGIGIFVPPSAAEPWISRHPRLLRTLEALDRPAQRPFASLADHILYRFVRNAA